MSTALAGRRRISEVAGIVSSYIQATGGTMYLSGGYMYHEFNSSGSFTVKSVPAFRDTSAGGPLSALSCIDIMLIGGGGGGGIQGGVGGAGGGGGGYVFTRGIRIFPGTYEVVIGAAGTSSAGTPTQGGDTAFGRGVMTTPLTALGGGAGYPAPFSGGGNRNGGSGGGGGWPLGNNGGVAQQPGSTTGGFGNNGKNGNGVNSAGGGGAGADPGFNTGGYYPKKGDLINRYGLTGYSEIPNLGPTNIYGYGYAGGGNVLGQTDEPANSGSGADGLTSAAGVAGSGNIILRYPYVSENYR